MPKICFVGDVHGQLAAMYSGVMAWMERTGTKVDGIVQVGDLGVYLRSTSWSTMFEQGIPAPIPTWVIMGNHESPVAIAEWQRNPDRIPGMHLLPDGGISDVLGIQMGAIWGNYSPISWLDPSRVHHHRCTADNERIAMHIDHDAVDRLLANHNPMDVLLTHDSAAATLPFQFHGHEMSSMIKGLLGLEENEHVAGCPAFNGLLKVFKPQHYFFGHLHCYDEGVLGKTEYTCLNALHHPGGAWMKVVEFPDYTLTACPNPDVCGCEADGGINILGGGQ